MSEHLDEVLAMRFADMDNAHFQSAMETASKVEGKAYVAVASGPIEYEDGRIFRRRFILSGDSEAGIRNEAGMVFRECQLAYVKIPVKPSPSDN